MVSFRDFIETDGKNHELRGRTLYVFGFGTALHKKSSHFIIHSDDDEADIPVKEVDFIVMDGAGSISRSALELANYHNILVTVIDIKGRIIGRFTTGKAGFGKVVKTQIRMFDGKASNVLAKNVILQKTWNQTRLLTMHGKRRGSMRNELYKLADRIKVQHSSIKNLDINAPDFSARIMGFEGVSSTAYFNGISYLLPKEYKFKHRAGHPSTDPFNALLNYGYVILASFIDRSLMQQGFDPSIGFLHSGHRYPALTYDVIEAFRQPIVDRACLSLVNKKMVKINEDFEMRRYISDHGKIQLRDAIHQYFENKCIVGDKEMRFWDAIENQITSLRGFINREISEIPSLKF